MPRTIRILFLSANPDDTTQLKVNEECNLIDSKIQASKFRKQFRLEQRHAVSLAELQAHLLRFKPNIVHFSGHGSQKGTLIFENSDGHAEEVSPKALSELFRILNEGTSGSDADNDRVRCVVLSACYSLQQAKAIARHVDFVIGLSDAVKDKSATNFAASFYQALGFGKSMQTAFELGRHQLELYEDPDEYILNMEHRSEIDPSKIFLASEVESTAEESKVKEELDNEKRKKNLSEHCSKLLEMSEFEKKFTELVFVDFNEQYYDPPIYQYGKQIIQHIYTGHRPLFDLLMEDRNLHQILFQIQEECTKRIGESLTTILSEYEIKVGDSSEQSERKFDLQSFNSLVFKILASSEKNNDQKIIWKDHQHPPLTWGDGGYQIYGITEDLGKKIASSLNDYVEKNHHQFKTYSDIHKKQSDAAEKFYQSFEEFFSNIRLGTTELSGGCQYCLSSKFHDEKEIAKLRTELDELNFKKT